MAVKPGATTEPWASMTRPALLQALQALQASLAAAFALSPLRGGSQSRTPKSASNLGILCLGLLEIDMYALDR